MSVNRLLVATLHSSSLVAYSGQPWSLPGVMRTVQVISWDSKTDIEIYLSYKMQNKIEWQASGVFSVW